MSSQLLYELGPPAGFPNCKTCAYWINGPVAVCVGCASPGLDPVAPAEIRCPVCSQATDPIAGCRNTLCRGPRAITRISAIATYSGSLADAIKALKYDGRWGWAAIFGRLVTGYLDRNVDPAKFDLIVANPTGPGCEPGRVAHTEAVLRSASDEDVFASWPFDPEALVRTRAVPRSVGAGAAARAANADALFAALAIDDHVSVRGKRVLVYDDVCTTGTQLNTVARFLRLHGARDVEGLVLARTPWGPRT